MSARNDLTGRRFGILTVTEGGGSKLYGSGRKHRSWRCVCDCGTTKVVWHTSLVSGDTKSCGCARYANLKDRRFGKLTVKDNCGTKLCGPVGKQQTIRSWRCVCDCGGTAIVRHGALVSGNTKSCGCERHRCGQRHPCYRGIGELGGKQWLNLLHGARTRGIPVTLTKEMAWRLFEEQGRRCALTGILLSHAKTVKSVGTASLDRIDSAKGYELGNVQWVHKHVNIMKRALTNPQFIAICRSVVAHVDRAEPANPVHNSPTGESTMRTITCL